MKPFDTQKVTKACAIADQILKKMLKELKKGVFQTEGDVAKFLRKETYAHNCKLAFRPIVAMQENAAEIHHKSNQTKLKKGFLVVDFGVKYRGYCSDCTRTFYLKGNPTQEEKALYELVLMAEETALMHAQPGVYAANIDLIARAALWEYFKHFVHSTGHGVGKRIHQAPNLRSKGKSKLKENQTITIEPGLYFKNKLGIRIEDTIIVKEKPIILTKISKELTKVIW